MKKIYLLLLLIIPLSIYSQTIYVSFAPTDLGIGARYDILDKNEIGLYTGLAKGIYQDPEGKIHHYKTEFGIKAYPEKERKTFITAGISLNHYNKVNKEAYHPYTFKPISISLGAGANIDRFSCAFRFDPVKWESTIDVGINLKKVKSKL